MKPRLLRVGSSASPVVVVDDFGAADEALEQAVALQPFPSVASGYYPGVRRVIAEADDAAFALAQRCCRDAAPFINGAFDIERFSLVEASFSMVTSDPAALRPPQRAPHFDSPDPRHLAMLLYVHLPAPSGTAFYRQRATGIERVEPSNLPAFIATAEKAATRQAADAGYFAGSDADYEQLDAIEAIPDRLLIYQGGLLHSGLIPADMPLSADPRVGRLTVNFFLQGQ